VILNLAVWFAVHTLFDRVGEAHVWGMRLLVPDWRSLDLAAAFIGAGAAVMIFWLKRGMIETLLAAAGVGCAYYLLAAA
jgi:chromate transporter